MKRLLGFVLGALFLLIPVVTFAAEKIDLDDLPIKEYDEALRFRDMLLEERKKSYKPRKVETVQETPNGLKKKKEWV